MAIGSPQYAECPVNRDFEVINFEKGMTKKKENLFGGIGKFEVQQFQTSN